MNWITVEELLLLHAQVIQATGGARGTLNLGAVQSAIARPFSSFAGEPLFISLFDRAAALVHSIIAFHPFADGNKRAALVACDVVLRLNGYRLVPSDEVEPFFWSIARGEQDVPQISNWIRQHAEAWAS